MSEGLDVVLIGIVGVFANLLILMVLISLLGRVVRARARAPKDGDDTRGRAAA